MIGKFVERIKGLIVVVLMLLLTLAIGGAVVALIGAIFGLSSVKHVGGSIAFLGAVGFFGWMFVTGDLAGALLGRSRQGPGDENNKNAKVDKNA
ncbi:hypothetical protein EN858_22770 [Mesorhizobium sp. M4B.F.Ca.ET.215.01.1.1]|uniref:hypothetical protein n=1 Tax=unclassified Mesorhizobium TaxID=325217 RepID=UPI000FC9DF66|nr:MULTISPECIES: hypothetical protein [unclassified Mesorhizobium]RUW21212.1 hypothetical protein EOA34_24935 [Mesorhizobium sp. M4B.F.Ca.ET.013.02.1.1]RVD40567.1 hypothetical protein EN741_16340 [Mesorhizobium sp. M4B.F.Ca.ET.019.03.1.1]RWA62282.1 MAG: hypothetical protein EOQ27_16540 [Mesorhizobium sp.]RWF65400.1 MAG: hypothetical protein EOS47_10930 [Mesorhizobium sp.]TGQ08065.1 hypothetical protein EN858_22770 [Mesorhizobium sp. M4B.F.Ca.ET.215.01.1.1]